MSLCTPKSKIRGQPCQLAWSCHALRKHLSLYAELDFPSLASWFFSTHRHMPCVWRQNGLWWDSHKTSWLWVCIHTRFFVSPLQPSLMPRKTALIQEIKNSHNQYKSIRTWVAWLKFLVANFNLGLFPSKVQKTCSFLEIAKKTVFT